MDDNITKNFKRSEFNCKCGCGYNVVTQRLADTLQEIRDYIGKPIVIVSGCRCETHNRKVGGVPESAHMKGEAADIMVKGWDAVELGSHIKNLYEAGKLRSLTYAYFPGRLTVHIGVDSKKRSRVFGW